MTTSDRDAADGRAPKATPSRLSRYSAALERFNESVADFQDRYRFPGAGDLFRTKESRAVHRAGRERAARARKSTR